MKIYLSIGLLCFGLTTGYAQSNKLDSLDRLIRQATTDTARINRQNSKIGLLTAINIDSAIRLGNATVSQSRKINYPKGEVKAWLKLAFCYNIKGDFARGRSSLRSAEQLLQTRPDSVLRCDTYAGYGAFYGMQSQYDSAAFYFEKAISLGQRIHHPSLQTFYQNTAISYQMQSRYLKALTYQQKALTMTEKDGDADSQAYVLMNMSTTYKMMGDTRRAEQFLFRAIKTARIAGIRNVELYAYSNLATLYEHERDYKKSYQFASKAATLGGQVGDQGIRAASLAKAAIALSQLTQFTKAEALAQQALIVADSAQQPLVTYQAHAAMGDVLKLMGNCQDAIPHLEKGFAVLDRSDIYDEQVGISYHTLSECYEKTGHYRQALSAYRQSAEIADSVRSRENIRKATELNMNADFTRRQQIISAERKREAAVANIKQLALLGGLVLTLILAVVSFVAFRTKHRANGLLQQQKDTIEDTLTKLKSTQDRLVHTEKMASLGELTAGIAHEIQNPLNFVNNFAEISTELVEELDEERQKPDPDVDLEDELLADIKQNLHKIHHHGRRAALIVKGMLAHSNVSSGQKEPTNLNALTDEYLRLAYHGLRAKDKDRVTGTRERDHFNAELVTDFDTSLGRVEVVPQEIGRVLLNLFNNAFYAVHQKQMQASQVVGSTDTDGYQPTVSVQTRQVDGPGDHRFIEIQVRDNGMGIPASIRQKIFQPFFTTKPTGEGTGLGLSLSYDIITKGHGGTLTVDSREGEGTTFTIQLPA